MQYLLPLVATGPGGLALFEGPIDAGEDPVPFVVEAGVCG